MQTLIRGGVVVTCDDRDQIVLGDVAVDDGAIVAMGREAAATLVSPYRVIDAEGCIVMPGLVQAHIHLVQTLFRGLADDVPLLAWLRKFIWPLEAAHDESSVALSAELGAAELLLGGTTTILDMGTVHGHDAVFDALARSGLRAVSGKAMMDAGRTSRRGCARRRGTACARASGSRRRGRGRPRGGSATRTARGSSCPARRSSCASARSSPRSTAP